MSAREDAIILVDELRVAGRITTVEAKALLAGLGKNIEAPITSSPVSGDTFSMRVRARRLELGWSQQQLADKVGVVQATIDKIERNNTSRSRYAVQIAQALGVCSNNVVAFCR